MERPLSTQKRIDTIAVAFSLVLALLITIAASLVITLIVAEDYSRGTPDGIDDSVGGGVVVMSTFFLSAFFLSPLWLWAGFRLRRVIGWPKGAFARTDRVDE
ncbi:MAG: hypothetical protein HZB71_11450 [Betaproteobacteria bacterium]|nr:hypothetical protein [Betaproteobacteria bacterium]